jgi:hypothetical protein
MTVTVNDERRNRRTTWLVFAVIFVILGGLALFFYRATESTGQAREKAGQLAAEFASAGLRVPSTDQIVNLLGDDGGATCDDPNTALKRGALLGALTNGASGPGLRPIIADNKVLQGQLLIVKVYCPEEQEKFAQTVQDLKLDDVAKG